MRAIDRGTVANTRPEADPSRGVLEAGLVGGRVPELLALLRVQQEPSVPGCVNASLVGHDGGLLLLSWTAVAREAMVSEGARLGLEGRRRDE